MASSEVRRAFNSLCRQGRHPLKKILIKEITHESNQVVNWCPICGTIVVDEDNLSCIIPGKVMSMTRPKILEQQNPV